MSDGDEEEYSDDSDDNEEDNGIQHEEQAESGYTKLGSGWMIPVLCAVVAVISYIAAFSDLLTIGLVAATIIAFIFSVIKINNPYERTVILRLGKFNRIAGEGMFAILPAVETGYRIDQRIRTSTFVAEQTLTKDNVPVDVDAVIFWNVKDVKSAVINIQDFFSSIQKASMTALRDTIGQSELSDMVSQKEKLDAKIESAIDAKVKNWGIDVSKVEIKEVRIPKALQDAMSRKAQAENERQARIILGDSEVQVAKKFADAGKVYSKNKEALHLRGMNMLFEALKESGSSIVIVPSSAVETMGFGGIIGSVTVKELIKKKKK